MKNIFLFLILFVVAESPRAQTSCDKKLWKHVYHPDRFRKIHSCITVSGVVDSLEAKTDGDEHILIKPDAGQEKWLKKKNILLLHSTLVVEIICQHTPSKKGAVEICSGYLNTIALPKKGDHISATGTYVVDTKHGWAEIHPVSSIQILEK